MARSIFWAKLKHLWPESKEKQAEEREEKALDLTMFNLPEIAVNQARDELNCRIEDMTFQKAEALPEAIYADVKSEDLALRVRSIYRYYQTGNTVVKALDGVSFDVKVGEFCAIVGTSGSGKSTLLNQLAGLEPATAGYVKVFGENISDMTENELVKFRLHNIGFIFQSFNLIKTLSAVENVSLPLVFKGISVKKRRQAAKVVLTQLGLKSHLKHLPNQMSGGQQQRIGIARALIVNPRIIYADEPTGNLDSKSAKETMLLMQKISKAKKQTVIMVTHDDHLAQYADRIFHIRDGKLIAVAKGKEAYQAAE